MIPTVRIVRSVFVMILVRLGSLNALEQTKSSRFWNQWLGGSIPSADTVGRVFALADCDTIRAGIHEVYTRLKRNKALQPPWHGLVALVLDGHESSASYRRCCPGCLQRTIHAAGGDRIQYYHHNGTAQLVTDDMPLPPCEYASFPKPAKTSSVADLKSATCGIADPWLDRLPAA